MARKREPPRSPRQKKTPAASGPSAEQDHGYVKMRAQLLQLGLQLREIPGDGNCLFRALADQLTGCAGDHKIHRRETVDFIVLHRDEFEPFVEDDVPFDRHVACLVDEGTYAGNDSIVAFARNHGVTVVIHQLEAPLWQIPGDPDNGADSPQLHIAYHDGEHYNSVRRMGDLGQGPANVHINLEAPSKAPTTTPEEREVMARSRCPDLAEVRRALNDCAGDVDAAADFLLALNWSQDVSDAPSSPSSPHQLTKAAAAATAAKLRNDKNAAQVAGRLERRQRREERDRRRRRKAAEPTELSSSPPAAVGHLAALTI